MTQVLKIVTGRGGSGKTAYILSEISARAQRGESGLILLVPEQYSHEAERRLAAFTGDTMSLHGEVLSFSRLANRVFTECGGLSDVIPDQGGRLLIMSLAVKSVSGQLKIYGRQAGKSDSLERLLAAREELSSCMVDIDQLLRAAQLAEGSMSDKLSDIALIAEAYDALLQKHLTDPRDKLTKLAAKIGESSIGRTGHIYLDGFTDFTNQERLILDELLKKNADLTVALCLDEDGSDIFQIPFQTMKRLIAMAEKRNVTVETRWMTGQPDRKSEALCCLERLLFEDIPDQTTIRSSDIELYAMNDIVSECQLAAARIRDLLREDDTLRCRDIAVVARGFGGYQAVCESVFRTYGLPVYIGRKTDILQKPVIALVTQALKIASGDWLYANIFRYLKTNLTGMSLDDTDLLDNYCVTWNLRGETIWTREEPWQMNPRGYVADETDADREHAQKVDQLRRIAAAPLVQLRDQGKKAVTARDQVKALYAFLEEIELPERLGDKAKQLKEKGELQLAEEYQQLWGILVGALEQSYEILGDLPMGRDEFSELLALLLSQYDVSSIPVALDRITLGELEAVREKNLRVLVVLGASDDALPNLTPETGLFTTQERHEMAALGLELRDSSEEGVSRELHAVYLALTRPSERLILTYPMSTGEGKSRPSYLLTRISRLFQLDPVPERTLEGTFLASAPAPAFQLAMSGGQTKISAAARIVVGELEGWAQRLQEASRLVRLPRGMLSQASVSALFGETFNLSATRAEQYNACRFSYFMQFGLRAKPRKKAGFEAPEMGTLVHYILENVTKDVKAAGGFKVVKAQRCRELAELYMRKYTEQLLGTAKKSKRFLYLFGRLKETVERIVLDVAEELSHSDFEPLDFELRFAGDGDLPPAVLQSERMRMQLHGMVDRVDGWVRGDKLYLRVCDYKTGRKAFSLSDIWYGIGLQMLIYLFVLEEHGRERYQRDIVPAGVLYAPARDIILPMPRGSTDAEIEAKRADQLKRSGLILDDPEVIAAMEDKSVPSYIPVRYKNGIPDGALASAERLGKLGKYIRQLLTKMGDEMKKGSIDADPFKIGGKLAPCEYCAFVSACRFDEKKDRSRAIAALRSDEVWERLDRLDGAEQS